jgi:hypothetical protein
MKTNQQKLNLKFHNTRGNYRDNKYWLETFNLIYQYLNENDIRNLNVMNTKLSIGTRVSTFLKQNNILYKNEFGFYKWNDKIPVSVKIIDAYRKYQFKKNSIYRDSQENVNQRNKSKQRIKVQFSDTPLEVVTENHRNTNTQEIGLIRKFLKWIY